jgi:hypothetical protein
MNSGDFLVFVKLQQGFVKLQQGFVKLQRLKFFPYSCFSVLL